MKTSLLLMTLAAFASAQLHAADTDAATNAINSLGIKLLAKTGTPETNTLLSPYSIQETLAMTYTGAAGRTREEMMTVLHFPKSADELINSFDALERRLADIEKNTAQIAADSQDGQAKEPVTLYLVNRLYAQQGYDFRKTLFELVKENFVNAPDKAAMLINTEVAEQTHNGIRDLIPKGALTKDTRLVLVNAIYFKAAWANEFYGGATKPAVFHANGGRTEDVPIMYHQANYGYAKKDSFTAVALPYIGSDLQFLILLPDDANGLAALESKLTPALLADCAKLEPADVKLWMPKFKLEPPGMALSGQLKALGMKSAFDDPRGSANFDEFAPRKTDDYLYISEVFHKTFLSLDEHGTEAAAATAVHAAGKATVLENKPKEVHVDHPFLFAIQDRQSGACLFLGRVADPH